MLLQHRLNEIASHISGYQSQIDELNAKIAALQAHAQRVGSVEAAMESAVQQLQTAIAMINQVCPDELADFKDVINEQFGTPVAELPASDTEVEPEPPAPTSPDAPEVFDSWEAADAAIQATKPSPVIDPAEGVIPEGEGDEATKPEWNDLSWPDFVKYAASKGIKTKGKKRGDIELELLNQ